MGTTKTLENVFFMYRALTGQIVGVLESTWINRHFLGSSLSHVVENFGIFVLIDLIDNKAKFSKKYIERFHTCTVHL